MLPFVTDEPPAAGPLPVRDATGATVAAMSVSTQLARVSRRQLLEEGLPVLRTAAVRLGQRPSG